MELNKKQIFLILILIMILFPPVYPSDDRLFPPSAECTTILGYTFVYFILTYTNNCALEDVNYPLLILQVLILCSVFLFILFKKKK